MHQYTIDDFIGIFPNAVSAQTCEKIIEHFEYINNLGHSASRRSAENTRFVDKDNKTYFLKNGRKNEDSVISDLDLYFTEEFKNAFWRCFDLYQQKYGVIESVGKLGFTGKFKLQKNEPGEGYHVWHCEQGDISSSSRFMLVILYLNTVGEGGETEFLYQHKRVSAEQGKMIIVPGAFTHTHRGNPPLSGDKYIMNTWVQFLE
jgi:hypothetical protein